MADGRTTSRSVAGELRRAGGGSYNDNPNATRWYGKPLG